MKNINKVIRHKIIEITICLLFIIVSFPMWEIFMKEEQFVLASTYAQSSLVSTEIINNQNYSFYPISDDVAMKYLVPMEVTLKSSSTYHSFFSLVMKVDKRSSLSFKSFKISVDQRIYWLKDLYLYEDSDFIYFLLSQGDIQNSNHQEIFKINLWLDSQALYPEYDATFLYQIINLENSLTV